jgi:hypothetical protein
MAPSAKVANAAVTRATPASAEATHGRPAAVKRELGSGIAAGT